MYRVKLVKGRSYTGAVKATKENPFADVPNKDTAEDLVASGYFELVPEEKAKPKTKKATKTEETPTADYDEDE